MRNPATHAVYDPGSEPALFLGRGFTGHEHLPWFGLINMNARLYDAALGRFLSPDPYVQAPDFSQSFNRYSYAWNNPLVYVDPDGEIVWFIVAAAVYVTFFTEPGYELQKYVSPVALKIDLGFGTHEIKLGFDVSVGIPKVSPYAYRMDYGKSYYWKHISSDYQGWETRKGYEHSVLGIAHWGKIKYTAGKFSQTVGFCKFGIPSNIGVDMYNDMWGDGGDRWRTSRTKINAIPGLGLDLILFTGDPGFKQGDRYINYDKGPHGTYALNPENPYAPDPNSHRAGVLALRIGPFSVGWDSEAIRNYFQNQLVHKMNGYPYFEDLSRNPNYYRRGKFYFQFGW